MPTTLLWAARLPVYFVPSQRPITSRKLRLFDVDGQQTLAIFTPEDGFDTTGIHETPLILNSEVGLRSYPAE